MNGVVPPSVTQTSFEYTSTTSTFIMNVAGKVSMNVTFLSPVTPNDLRRQSAIGSYLSVTVAAIDGGSHSVQLYADTSAGMYPVLHPIRERDLTYNLEWTSIHNSDTAQWRFVTRRSV